jgi:hypothetical protein
VLHRLLLAVRHLQHRHRLLVRLKALLQLQRRATPAAHQLYRQAVLLLVHQQQPHLLSAKKAVYPNLLVAQLLPAPHLVQLLFLVRLLPLEQHPP